MYVIMDIGGKQYKVQEGDVVFVDKFDAEEGSLINIDNILAYSREDSMVFGKPTLEGISVDAKILGHGKDKKIIVFKYKAKKNYRRTQGHRQAYTKIQIDKINLGNYAEDNVEDSVAN